jgi:hypothetical protein
MAWSGGTFTRVHDWTDDAAGAFPNIEASRMDAEDDNFETGIDSCLHKAGQNAATGNLPMGGFRHTNVDDAAALTDYASAADVIDCHLTYYVDTGSANTYVITPSPAISAYAEGQSFIFRASANNTGTSTLNVNNLGAFDIENPDGTDLTAGQIVIGGYYQVIYDANATPDRWVLLSPNSDLADQIDHDSLSGFVANEHIDHTSVTITAGSALSYSVGGTDISADATIDVDLTGLSQYDSDDIAAGDEILVNDGGTNKAMRFQDLGVAQTDDATTTPLSGADLTFANRIYNCNNASAISAVIPANASVAYPIGTVLGFCQIGAGAVTVTVTSDTLNAPDSNTATRVQYSTIFARKTAATVWVLSGDLG